MKIACLTKNFKGQTPSGGYDQLAKFLGATAIGRPVISSVPLRIAEKGWHFLYGSKPHLFSHLSHGYHFEDRLCEERAFWHSVFVRPDIVHVLYGDWMLDTLLRRRRLLPGKLVATFHLPSEYVIDRFERQHEEALSKLDGAVLLASQQRPEFSKWLGHEKVTVIPHGIDIDVFKPPQEFIQRQTTRFIFIGMMLRDFDIAHRVIDACRQAAIDAEFILIIPEAARSYFTGCSNARIMTNISEEELICIYQSSDALFLPLLGAIANNAILEALACGLPIITTDVGGVPDYVTGECGWLLPPSNVETAFDCVREIVKDSQIARDKRKAARQKAEKFSWHRIAAAMSDAYSQLHETGRFAPEPNSVTPDNSSTRPLGLLHQRSQ